MNKLAVVGFLILATALEASGDAVVRLGLSQHARAPRALLFLTGAAMLFGYGILLNFAPLEFGRIVGAYVAILFIVWQVVNLIAFRSFPSGPTLVGGALIVLGGAIVAFWQR